jgi:HAD superfamily hydrolase (TIGR01509 family)
MKNIRGILFDLDDTLIPSEALYAIGLRAAHAKLQSFKPVSWSRFFALYKKSRALVKAQLGTRPAARNRVLYFKTLVELCFGLQRPRITLALFDAFNTAWADIQAAEIHAVAIPLAQRFKLGVITNQLSLTQLQKMERIDPLGAYFKILVTSEDAGVEKPDPRIYKMACKKLGTRPAQTLLVGDSWSADVMGGIKAGLPVAFLSLSPPGRRLPSRCFHIRSIAELPQLLVK